jgi:crotonobetainyl-CoA:carnitine CoA-transferase CaiB-like acyl-CoA transferase
MLQPGRYFADVCKHLALEHLLEDDRFTTAEGLMANAAEAGRAVAEAIAKKPYAYWLEHLQTMEGQWAPLQNLAELVEDPQVKANGYVVPITDAEGNDRRLVANPVQFDGVSPAITSAPEMGQHTEDVLLSIGLTWDDLAALK